MNTFTFAKTVRFFCLYIKFGKAQFNDHQVDKCIFTSKMLIRVQFKATLIVCSITFLWADT